MMEIKLTKYGTTDSYCGCPDYLYRQAKIGGSCKHMIYSIQKKNTVQTKISPDCKFNPDDFRGLGMELQEAGDKYGDGVLKKWQRIGDIYLDKKRMRWRILE